MDTALIVCTTGLAANTVASIAQLYVAFKKSNVEEFFKRLVDAKPNLGIFEDDETLMRKFLGVIDRVSQEANVKKIENWKNATIHLATDYSTFDFNDEFIRCLADVSVFDLTLLHKVYATDFEKEHFEGELQAFVATKGVSGEYVVQSLKRLALHNLISESYDKTAVIGRNDREPILGPFHYTKNTLGPGFIRFACEGER